MSKTIRRSKREQQKANRRQARKRAKKNKHGRKAGSIAIHSRLPGLEGTEIGAMEVIVDTRRKETHPAELSITIHRHAERRTIAWSIETGFGGLPSRVGYQVLPDNGVDDVPPIVWMDELEREVSPPDGDNHEREHEVSPPDGDTHEREYEVSPSDGDTYRKQCAVSPPDGDTCE